MRNRGQKRKGFSLMEVTLVIATVMIMLGSYMYMITQNMKTVDDKDVADHLRYVADAAERYLSANRANLVTITQGGALIEVPTARTSMDEVVPSSGRTVPGMQEGGFLPGNFVDSDIYNFHTDLLIRQPLTGVLEAMLVVKNDGLGKTISAKEAGYIVSLLGMRGGVMLGQSSSSSLTLTGEKGNYIYGNNELWQYDAGVWSYGNSTPSFNKPVMFLTSYPDPMAANHINRNDVGMYGTHTMYMDLSAPKNSINGVLAYSTNTINAQSDNMIHVVNNMEVSGNMSVGHDENGNTFNVQGVGGSAFYNLTAADDFHPLNSLLPGGIRTYDAYTEGAFYAGTQTHLNAMLGGGAEAVISTSLLTAGVLRPSYTATIGQHCLGEPVQILALNPNNADDTQTSTPSSYARVSIGDIAKASDGSWLSCQNLTDNKGNVSQVWSAVKNPFTTFKGCVPGSGVAGSAYTNTSGVPEFVQAYSDFQNVKHGGNFNLYVSPSGASGGALVSSEQINESSVKFKLLFFHWTSHYKIGNRYSGASIVPVNYTIYSNSGQNSVEYCRWG